MAADSLSVEELRSPDGWSWVYDCLHGHTRKHLAMLGPWCGVAIMAEPRDRPASRACPTGRRA